MKEFLRLLRYAAPYRGRLTVAILAMIVYALGNYQLGRLVKPIFDNALQLDGAAAGVGVTLGWLAMRILGAYLLKGVGGYISEYFMTYVGQRVVMDLRNHLFRRILGQSAAFFTRNASGQLLSRITNDVGQVQYAVSETAGDLIREALTLVVWIWLMFKYDWELAIVCLTAAPLVLYPLVRLGRKVRSTTRRSQEDLEHLTHVTNEAFAGHRIVKAFGAEARESERFNRASARLFRTNMRVTSALSVLPPMMEFMGGLAMVGALWYGSGRISRGLLTPGQFSGFLFAAFMMYTPVKKLSRVNASVQQAMAASQRIFELIDVRSEVRETDGATVMPRLADRVEFRNVGFTYGDRPGHFTLRHISMSVRAGQIVAIVGLSGAGKTTLVNLIPRFFDVTEGDLLIDGRNIRDVTIRSLRDQVALVTQETVLFDDTIAANIAYGAPQATLGEIEQAARAAHAHEFIASRPGGYAARIGERGQQLSGGERQRIAIARAILKNSPLLILDEATSSLDLESERLVQAALANLMMNRTTFVIAHRLATVRRADTIVVLDRGRIVETGTHFELLARSGGAYAKLYALQTFEDDHELEPPARLREVRS